MNIFKKNTEKHTEKLPMTGKVKKGFRIYCTAIKMCIRDRTITEPDTLRDVSPVPGEGGANLP